MNAGAVVGGNPDGHATAPDARLELLRRWLAEGLGWGAVRVEPASADASFRRYFRAWRDGQSFVVMDAPPDKEDIGPYVTIARMLLDTGVNVPRILAENRRHGFLLLTDLGSLPYLAALRDEAQVEPLYADALRALCNIQSRGAAHAGRLEPYDRGKLLAEMELMPQWFCRRHLGLQLTDSDRSMLERTFDVLCREALAQPQVFVHRDYHSRNLMVCPADNPGILDFQDAVRGPVTYDLVSLLKDCYIEWPRERVVGWVQAWRAMAEQAGVDAGAGEEQLLRWFDLMGAQRHIKVLGIFSRLYHRDGKSGYLADLPRVLNYVREVCGRYPELNDLGAFLARITLPAAGTS